MVRYSIIVPVYNAEQYLSEAVESVLKQTFPDWELILVNDGSTDSSDSICQNYVLADSRVKYIKKENGGVSDTRNVGLHNAQGEYIVFLDADDWIDINYLFKVEEILKETSVDIMILNYFHVRDGHVKEAHSISNELCEGIQTDVNDLINFSLKLSSGLCDKWHGIMRPVWAKVFKTSIIKDNKIAFDTQLKYGEDAAFLFNYLQYIHSIVYKDWYVYYYRDNAASVMNNKKWVGIAPGKHYFDIVEKTLSDDILEEARALFWFNIAENDWKVLANSKLTKIQKRKEMRQMILDSNYQRFSRKELSKSLGKKHKIEAFFIRNKLAGMLLLMYKIKEIRKK